ncbi:hypothetical protein PP175_21540 [Aneurinibacillus sp. Ricciae_BoGa-3]|uniref:hypothetical protein n=1 Tax=Aneurinibacillus sp. Ricciae_BoGa-3 TaxID=3022697 RepID=UPI00233F8349|nr:hypothetical protein [Aneurinibacillus sp. Ricciae_BoGa-3]WCK53875.1 hypothetical protein PP175_21540 [Aneurinibacillus sp. Ricciae_BoGa-3]
MNELPFGVQLALLHGTRMMLECFNSSLYLAENSLKEKDFYRLYLDESYRELNEALEYLKSLNNLAYKEQIKGFEPLQQRYLKLKESLLTERKAGEPIGSR